MLVIEIASGIFLGWLTIQVVQGLAAKRRQTVPEAIWAIFSKTVFFSIIVLCVSFPIVAVIEYRNEIGQYAQRAREHQNIVVICFVVFIVGSLGFAFYSDWRARQSATRLAVNAYCAQCGQQGLNFRRFKDGLDQGHKYPMASCPKCGQEQPLPV